MNRIFKFRAWDKASSRFISTDEWAFIKICDCEKDIYIIQQFTGLKDVNNKEIYEGDIIKQLGLPGGGEREEIISICIWEEGRYILKRFKGQGFGSKKYGVEIIGNIFENKNLLDEDESRSLQINS